MALTTDVFEGPFTVVARRLLETSEMVRLAETNSALRQLWRELLEEKKAEVIDARALELLRAKARGATFASKAMNFKKSCLTDDDLALLCFSAQFSISMSHVEDFCLNVNEISDRGFGQWTRLGTLLPFSCLTDFFAIDNLLGDYAAKALAQAAREGAFPSLRLMYLYGNEIGDAGFEALSDAMTEGVFAPSGLETLLVMGNEITDEGLLCIEKPMLMGRLHGLQSFGVGNGVTDRGLELLVDGSVRGHLPELRSVASQGNPVQLE